MWEHTFGETIIGKYEIMYTVENYTFNLYESYIGKIVQELEELFV